MMKHITTMMLMTVALQASAQVKTTVTEFLQAGPFPVSTPAAADTVDVNGKRFDDAAMMAAIQLSATPTTTFKGGLLPSMVDSKSVGVLSFFVNNTSYVKGKVNVSGPKHYKLYIDGK